MATKRSLDGESPRLNTQGQCSGGGGGIPIDHRPPHEYGCRPIPLQRLPSLISLHVLVAARQGWDDLDSSSAGRSIKIDG
jgi:hypothetical protein